MRFDSFSAPAVLGIAFLTGCATVEPRVYQPGVLSPEKSYSVGFMYEKGSDETRVAETSVERRTVREGQPAKVLAFRDELIFRLQDEGVKIVGEDRNPDLYILLHPTFRSSSCVRTCGVFETLSVTFGDKPGAEEAIARIQIRNGAGAEAKDDAGFTKLVAREILKLLKQTK